MKSPWSSVFVVAFALGATWAAPAQAAQVAPNVVFINAGDRGAELMVRNGGETPIEVEISLIFGYEDTDSEGRVQTVYPDESRARSAADWVRAYPQRAVVPPGSRQSIRLFSRAPPDVAPGEYWARVQVQTRPTQIASQAVDEDEQIRVRVGVTTQQRIPIFVRIGEPRASLAVSAARAVYQDEEATDGMRDRSLVARYRASLRGNAAFLGSMVARIEKEGRLLAEREAPLAVFVPGERRLRIPLPDAVSASDLEGAKLILEARREHPVIQERHLVPGRMGRWEGPVALE